MYKKSVVLLVVFLLVLSPVVAQDITTEDCNFLCKFVQFWVGDKDLRGGASWFDRGNLVG